MSLAAIGIGLEVFDALPETDANRCNLALLEGRYLAASFDCPALAFLHGVFGSDDELVDDEGDEE